MAFKLDNIPPANNKPSLSNNLDTLLKKEITLFGSGFNNKKKQVFYLELGVLLKAGITIKEALTLIVDSFKKEKDKELLKGVLYQIINGKPLSESLYASNQFTEYEYYSLKIGEETGNTSRICQQLGVFYERKNEQKRIVVSALTYPSIVIFTAMLVVYFMLSYVVPMFEDIFKQNKMELPFLTQVIVKMSAGVRSYGFIIILVLVSLFFLGSFLKDNYRYKKIIHYALLKIPVFGPFIKKVYLTQFTQALTLLTSSKVPILNSIQMVKKMIRFVPLQETLQNVEDNILKGNTLSESIEGSKIFDKRIISLVKVSEETNQTEYVFKQLNEQYNQEVIQQSKIMATVLEPFIILFVGVIVAILLIAMYLPMFQLSSAIG